MKQSRFKRFIAAILTVVNIGTVAGCAKKSVNEEDYQEALTTIENLKNDLTQYEEEIAKLTDAKEDLEQENKTQKDEIADLEKEVQSLKKDMEKQKDEQPEKPDKNEDEELDKSDNNNVDISASLVPCTNEIASLIGLSEKDLLNNDVKNNIEKLNAYLIECKNIKDNLYYRLDKDNKLIFYTFLNSTWEQEVATISYVKRYFKIELRYPTSLNPNLFNNSMLIYLDETNSKTIFNSNNTNWFLADDNTFNSLEVINPNSTYHIDYIDNDCIDDYVPYINIIINDNRTLSLSIENTLDSATKKEYNFNLSKNDYQMLVDLFNSCMENNDNPNVLAYFKDAILEIGQKYGNDEEYKEINEYFETITASNLRLKK